MTRREGKCYADIQVIIPSVDNRIWDNFHGRWGVAIMEWLVQKVRNCAFYAY